jgi:hypothetical protein
MQIHIPYTKISAKYVEFAPLYAGNRMFCTKLLQIRANLDFPFMLKEAYSEGIYHRVYK